MGNERTLGVAGSGCFGGADVIGGEIRPPEANGGRSGAVAFVLEGAGGSAGSATSSIGLAGLGSTSLAGAGPAVFNGTRIGGGVAGVAGTTAGVVGTAAGATATGGRIAIGGRWITGGTGGADADGSSSLSPPLRSA